MKTIETTIDIIDFLTDNDGATVTEIANYLDRAPSTVHNYLTTLEQNRYLVKEGNEYHIGLLFLNIGGYVLNRKPAYDLALAEVEELARETEERSQFIVEEHGLGIKLHNKPGAKAVRLDSRIGHETRLHVTSAGKAILAHLPESRVDEIIEHWGLPRMTENTRTTREELYRDLEQIQERGYALNKEERVEGVRAVGAPVMDEDGTVIGALSVSGPANRLKGDWYREGIPDILLGATNELELKIAYE